MKELYLSFFIETLLLFAHLPITQRARFAKLQAAFVARYGKNPEFYARSPGRVNIIGKLHESLIHI